MERGVELYKHIQIGRVGTYSNGEEYDRGISRGGSTESMSKRVSAIDKARGGNENRV